MPAPFAPGRKTREAILISESRDAYEARGKRLTASAFLDFARDPELYAAKHIAGSVPSRDSENLLFGRALHTRVLLGEQALEDQFFIGDCPEINTRTKRPFTPESQKYQEWAASLPKPPLSLDAFGTIACMADHIGQHEEASRLLCGAWTEKTCQATVERVPCKARFDAISETALVNLKTTERLDDFQEQMQRFDYLGQLAFEEAVAFAAGLTLERVAIIAAEKVAPYRVGIWEPTRACRAMMHAKVYDHLDKYHECAAANVWPSAYVKPIPITAAGQ